MIGEERIKEKEYAEGEKCKGKMKGKVGRKFRCKRTTRKRFDWSRTEGILVRRPTKSYRGT